MNLAVGPLEPTSIPSLATDLLVLASNLDTRPTKPDAAGSERPTPDPALLALDAALSGELMAALFAERFTGKPGQAVVLSPLGRIPARRLAVLGTGPSQTPDSLRIFAGRAARLATSLGATSLTLCAPAADPAARMACAEALTEGALLGAYRFDKYLSEDKRVPNSVASLDLRLPGSADVDTALARAKNTATAVARARDLINEPAEVMTPVHLAAHASELAKQHGLSVEILDRAACEKERMGLFLAVARGSRQEPRFIHLAWKPAGAKKRIALVGKGITFDSGGLSLKPSDAMLDMKTDMAGAAAVLSVMPVVADEKLPLEVHAFAACTENMIGGNAYRLGDVFRSRAGKTVEINNTDAEGRLTLADALSYALDYKPDAIFDFATLTGACVIALGPHTAGVMSNNEPLQRAFLQAAAQAGEPMWPLPLPERLLEQLKSEIADLKNTGERYGGALTAGLFLKEFVGDTPWVHVDIAGPSRTDKDYGHISRGASGFAVATILAYLRTLSFS